MFYQQFHFENNNIQSKDYHQNIIIKWKSIWVTYSLRRFDLFIKFSDKDFVCDKYINYLIFLPLIHVKLCGNDKSGSRFLSEIEFTIRNRIDYIPTTFPDFLSHTFKINILLVYLFLFLLSSRYLWKNLRLQNCLILFFWLIWLILILLLLLFNECIWK